eukprot:Em0003g1182a
MSALKLALLLVAFAVISSSVQAEAQFLTRARDDVCKTVLFPLTPFAPSRVKYSSSVWNVPGAHSRVLILSTVVSRSAHQDASVPTARCWMKTQRDVSH